jgi:hypothetical protein
MPSLVRRKTSLTMRQRLTPEIVCSTTTRALEKIVLMNFSPTLNSLPLGFFWLPGLASCRLIPLQARVFVERGVGWIRDLRVIRGLLIVCFARYGGTQIHDLLRVGIDEEDVCVRVCFLLAAVVCLLFGVIFRTLAAAFAPVNRQVGTASACSNSNFGLAGSLRLLMDTDLATVGFP